MTRIIKASENNGSIRIRLTIKSQKFNITLSGLHWDNSNDRARADAVAAKVTADLANGCFDTTLKSYEVTTAEDQMQRIPNSGDQALTSQTSVLSPNKRTKLTKLQLWDKWVQSLQLPSYTKAGHYHSTRRAIERGDVLRPDLSAFVYNLRRRQLSQCYQWGIEHGHATTNPYEGIKAKRAKRQTIRVFTSTELKAILSTFNEHWPNYSDFIEALMVSGCRFGECAGIQRNAIDLNRQVVTIKASVRRNIQTNEIELRQGTKTETVRELESPQLITILLRHGLPTNAGELVFKNSRGTPIRRNSFTQSVWKPALKKANVEHRRIHVLRHTCLSMALAKGGVSVPDVAYLAGHRDSTMVIRTYGHVIDRPELPELDL